MVLILLLEILRQYSYLIDDGVYLRHYFPVFDQLPRAQSKLLDLEDEIHKVCK